MRISVASENLKWVVEERCDSPFFKYDVKGYMPNGGILVIAGCTDEVDLMKYLKKENIKNPTFVYTHSACCRCRLCYLCGNNEQVVRCNLH